MDLLLDRCCVFGFAQPNRDVGVSGSEPADQQRERVDGERGESNDVETAGVEFGGGSADCDELGGFAQHTAGGFDDVFACGCWLDLPAEPEEEFDPEFRFEAPNPIGQRWL
ncbi:MAG TPA: hypothetical protein PLV68_14400 [Ilumatobacteraceae bacterium]|nr:hypothetical protein [Ilumatobacteraceae bacterium]